jgi:aarF domain-containing kinase
MNSLHAADSWAASEFDDSAAAFASILDVVREHEVTMPGHICAVLVTTLVLEGWSSRLAPEHSVLQQVKSVVAMDSEHWRERMSNNVDKLMGWGPMWPVS